MATKPNYQISQQGAAGAPQRMRMLSGVCDASVDVRKACNGIKRMASLGAASMVTGVDIKRIVAAAEKMAHDVLVSIGFDVSDQQRLQHVLPMMMEATAAVLADAAWNADDTKMGAEALTTATKFGVSVLSEVAKSRAVAKMVEPGYPQDIDAVVALRLSAAAAMAQVAVQVAEFDFAHSATECVKEAGKAVVKAAMDASACLAPAQASPSARLMLSQSLIQSAAKVYAASWRVIAAGEIERLDGLGSDAREASLDAMAATPMATLLVPVNSRFTAAFVGIAETAREVFADPGAGPASVARAPTAKPR